MLFLIITLSALSLVGVRAQDPAQTTASPYTTCSFLPSVPIDYTLAARYSPLLVMRSSEPGYQCATGFLTGPAPLESQNYTFVITQNTTVLNSFQVYPNNTGNYTQLTMCDKDVELIYKFLPYVMNQTECFFVTYICNTKDDSLYLVRAYGHKQADQTLIDNVIKQYNLAGIKGGENILQTWQGCQFQPFCEGFFM